MQQESLIGSYHRFGEAGTVYQVLDTLDDSLVKIRVLETGEEASYPLAQVLADPEEGWMYAISFDLTVADTAKVHPVSVAQAYADIGKVLAQFSFQRVQGSLYVTQNEDMALLFHAIMTLKSQSWFPQAVRDIRAFRVEQWSDFTAIIKG